MFKLLKFIDEYKAFQKEYNNHFSFKNLKEAAKLLVQRREVNEK